MPGRHEIEHLIRSIQRSLSYANHGMIEVSVDAAREILDVLIDSIAEDKGGEKE